MAGIIKAADNDAQAQWLEPFSFRDVHEEASEIVRQARSHAEAIVTEAHSAGEVIRADAERAGYQSGHQRGLAEGGEAGRNEALAAAQREFTEQSAALVALLEQALAESDRAKRTMLSDAYRDLVTLAVAIAERVVKQLGRIDQEVAVANLRELIEHVGKRSDTVLEVHPDDLGAIQTFAASLTQSDEHRAHMHIVADESVSRGGCRYRYGAGVVDATLEAQIDQIAQSLLPMREETA